MSHIVPEAVRRYRQIIVLLDQFHPDKKRRDFWLKSLVRSNWYSRLEIFDYRPCFISDPGFRVQISLISLAILAWRLLEVVRLP